MKFSWDPNKSASNKEKHGIDFNQAKDVFNDDNAIKDWLSKNTGKMKDIVNKLVVDLYHTDKILHSK